MKSIAFGLKNTKKKHKGQSGMVGWAILPVGIGESRPICGCGRDLQHLKIIARFFARRLLK
jgi:hypothetical protein